MSSAVHILETINDIPPHSPGYWRDSPLNMANFLVTATGAVVVAASAPSVVVTGLSVDDAETFLLRVAIPGDYAPDSHDGDGLKIRLLCSAATSGTFSMGTTANRYRAGGTAAGVSVTFDTAPGTKTIDNITNEIVEFDVSGSGWQAGDIIDFTITATNSSTDEIIVKGGVVRYKSIFVLATESERI